RALGASGGVTAIVFANILLDPGKSSIYMFMMPFPIPSPVYAVIYILVSYYALKRNQGNIGHDAHLGGALAGIVAAIFIDTRTLSNHP
ncbi:rhomboid family intramembrane serine protease, partial [Acinetobacter baumannii]